MKADVQNLKIIKDFLTEYKTQYRRGNAMPVYYTIMDYYTCFVQDRCGEPYLYEDGEFLNYERYSVKHDLSITEEDFMDLPDVVYGYTEERSYQRGMFLTESDAEEHLQKNYYHYSPNAHTYVETAFRAPKLEAFLAALMEFFGISGEEKARPLYGTYKKAEDYEKAFLKGEKNV